MKPGLTALALAAAAFASLAPASADAHRVRVGVGGHVRWSAGVVVVGGTTPAPPPPVAYPTYSTYPAPAPAPVYAPTYQQPYPPAPEYYAPPPPPRPVLGLGLVLSSVDVDEGRLEGSGIGLVGRLRLAQRFELELQLSQDRFLDDPRVDSRFGVAGLVELGRPGGLSPYLLLGVGANVIQPLGERAGQDADTLPTQAYVEGGVGLAWELTRNFTLSGDLRVQARQLDEQTVAARSSLTAAIPDQESAAEARVNLLWYF